MTTIDHAAEARSTLVAIGYPDSNEGCLAVAQVHATLALVEAQREANEQTRIANIIALSVPQGIPGQDGEVTVCIPSFDEGFELRDDIKTGLGL